MEDELLKDLTDDNELYEDVPGEKEFDVLTAVDFNLEDKKISLSVKALMEPEVEEKAEEDADVVSVDIEKAIEEGVEE